jgi:hypothetical protein
MHNQFKEGETEMVKGFLGIEYSTNEIRNGRFVDGTLERDFISTRYDMLRRADKRFFNESEWRKNTVEARQEFLKMMEQAEERNKIDLDNDDEEAVLPTDTFTYTGPEKPPKEVKTLIISSDLK